MKNPASLDAFCFCEQDGLFMACCGRFITRGFILEVRMYLRGVCVTLLWRLVPNEMLCQASGINVPCA